MKKIYILVPLLALFFFLHNPLCANAEEYLGQDYASVTRFTTRYGWYGRNDTVNNFRQDWVITCDNPNSTVFVIAQELPHYDGGMSFCRIDYVLLGSPANVSVFRNGSLVRSDKVNPIDLSVLTNNPSKVMNIYVMPNELNLTPLVSDGMGSYPTNSPTLRYEPENISGYFYYESHRSSSVTYNELYSILSKYKDFGYFEEEFDKSVPLPQLKFNELSGSTFFNFTNGTSDRTVDIRIKAYAPASIYFNSVSLNPLDRFLDKYEYVITSEISSNYFKYSDMPSDAYFVLNGFNTNWKDNVDVIDIFNDFVPFCQLAQDNVAFEYANAWVAVNCKTDSFLNTCLLLYNTAFYEMEGYARFVETDGSKVKVGPWQHFVIERGGNVSQSTNPDGLIELPDEDSDDRDNPDLTPVTPSIPDNIEDFDTTSLWSTIQSLVYGMGVIPSIVSQIFSFLPDWLIFMIAVGIAALVILRFVGR